MIRRTFLTLFTVVALTLLSASTAMAQTATDSQAFTVRIPSLISVTAPEDALLTLNKEEDDHSFTPQLWRVRCNARNGATFVVTTRSAFVNGSFKRDAKLFLEKASGSSSWKVGIATATTAYPTTEVVSVNASSTQPGAAAFNLTVTLIDNSYDDLAAGDYVMTVDGTITAN